mgnify:CR=1 FL=1
MLDLTPLEKAIAALKQSIQICAGNDLPRDAAEKALLRDGVIQRFEFTFELAWKTLKRYLEEYGSLRKSAISIKDLFRMGAEQGLLAETTVWFEYLEMRNQTSHIDNESQAQSVFERVSKFAYDASELSANIKSQLQ